MLFNSYSFIFLFLPLTLLVFFALGRHRDLAIGWLTVCSLFFYGWWNPNYLLLLSASIAFNYLVGKQLAKRPHKPLLILGITGNILLLGYFKYAGFVSTAVGSLIGVDFGVANIILPLGISFFTFTQIAFLVDVYKGEVKEYRFLHYCLFVTYFPHLLAGPILHHKEMMPQFGSSVGYRPNAENFAVGLSLFFIGLFKKVVLADGIAPYAKMAFDTAQEGLMLTFFEAWGGVLAYSMQLYFDFSGYSDMAAGISLLFGIKLPLNFYSPYRATSIIDFWHRWHMSLSRFLRDYVYIPLGGNRNGTCRRHTNLLLTMLIGGLWHGAGWTFLIWGGLHGLYLVINHLWRSAWQKWGWPVEKTPLTARLAGWLLTFGAVTLAWTFFRAANLSTSLAMLDAMFGGNGIALPERFYFDLGPLGERLHSYGVIFKALNAGDIISLGGVAQIGLLTAIAILCPNSTQLMQHFQPTLKPEKLPTLPTGLIWRPNRTWAVAMSILGLLGLVNITQLSEFLYYQF